jgi:prevent-host-death family protein
MTHVTLEEAQKQLPRLIQEAGEGEEIIITQDSRPIARLVSLPGVKPKPQFGSARGLIQMADDFDAPLEDFKEYS